MPLVKDQVRHLLRLRFCSLFVFLAVRLPRYSKATQNSIRGIMCHGVTDEVSSLNAWRRHTPNQPSSVKRKHGEHVAFDSSSICGVCRSTRKKKERGKLGFLGIIFLRPVADKLCRPRVDSCCTSRFHQRSVCCPCRVRTRLNRCANVQSRRRSTS